jgi:hypothetical protein
MTPDDDAEHDDTPYPIIEERAVSWRQVRALRRLRSDPGEAHVLYRNGRTVMVVRPEERQSNWQIRLSRFTRVASVDMRPRDLTLEGQLACHGGAHYFNVMVQLTCRVRQPEAVMAANIRDARSRLKRTIFERVAHIHHEHNVDDVNSARTAILERISSEELTALEPAFELTRVHVEVHVDESLQELLRADLERTYYESVVRGGPEAIVAHCLSRPEGSPEAALRMLQEQEREQVRMRREEEEYLIRNHIVRAEQLEEPALQRLEGLELPAKTRPSPAVAALGDGSRESVTVTVHGDLASAVPAEPAAPSDR